MKKLLLILLMLSGFGVFAQLPENFEGGTFPPPGWAIFDNGIGTTISWAETTNAALTYGGTGKSAYLNRENVPDGTFAVDWMVTPGLTVPNNAQFRFQTKNIQAGLQGSILDVRISTTSQTNTASFTTVQSWDDNNLTTTNNVYEEKIIDLNPTTYPPGSTIYIAFVMTNDNGDRWLVDNVNLVQKCNAPIGPLNTANESTNSAQLSWGNPGGITEWEVQVVEFALPFTDPSVITYTNVLTNPFTATGLQPNTLYKFQVRSVCTGSLGEYASDWFGPRSFQTSSFGDTCAGPITVGPLPYSHTDNTANYLDTNDLQPPLACTGSATNYMAGNDVFYAFTPNFTGNVSITLTPTTANSSIHIYNLCPGTPGATCLWGAGNANSNPRVNNSFAVVNGTTYYIIISSAAASQTVGYTLTIQQAFCNQPTGLTATNITTTSADLAWAPNAGTTSWQYSYAPAPYALPTGAGTTTGTNAGTTVTGIPGIVYQYYVRADCNDGNFSTWAGPFTFTLPQVATPLNFTDGFETLTGWTLSSNNQPNKWAVGTGINNGGTHALYVTDTNGTTNTYNNTGTTVAHAYKDFIIPAGATQLDFTFDWRSLGEVADYFRVWTVPAAFNPTVGTQITALANSRIKVGPDFTGSTNFATNNFTVNAAPYAGGTMRVVFEWRNNGTAGNQPPAAIDNIKLDLVTCPKPMNPTITNINYNNAQVNWANGASETAWEVLVLPQNATPPTGASVGIPVSTNPYIITGLTSVTCYDVYVRAVCSPTDKSFWSVAATFCTTPHFCAGDHFQDTGGLTGAYSNSQNIVTTVCPDNVGDVVTVVFNQFNVAAGDNLVIRDGNLITSPIVGTYTGTNLPPSFTSTSASGCLTFVFTSNATGTAAGWDATIYCTPPITCFKPVTLTVTNIGATTAQLNWVETGTASQWEILVLPVNSPVPSVGQSGIPVSTNPYIVTGLSPSTTYTFYVRAICSSTDESFWSDGVTFSTTPINDSCINATNAIVNDDLICSQVNSGTLFGSTNTAGVPAGCSPTANDVWYRFVATRTTHTMSILNVVPAVDLDFGLYTGANCTSLTQVQCFTAAQNVINNLVIGQVYYIRVFAPSNQQAEFDFCIGGVPCPESVSLCNAPITYPNTTNVINLGDYACLGSSPNASFFFLEAAQNGTLAYTISQTSGDVDYALWGPFPNRNFGCGLIPMEESGNGTAYPNDPVQCSYSTAAIENFSVNVLQGQVYILMVTNFANTAGTITISPNPTNTAQSFCYPYNTFNYDDITYCNSSPNETPVLLAGAVGGTYTAVRIEDGSTTAMSINPTTGEINFLASLPGTYTVTSTLIPNLPAPASNAPIICTRTVIITPTPNATISYTNAPYCKSTTTPQAVTIGGNGGQGSYFSSSPAGLENALDPNTGNIIPVLANVGIYTVTFTVPAQGGCAQYTTTTQVEILASPVIPAQVDVNGCNSYMLPALTVGNYYMASGGTGTMLNAGDLITANQTIYVYATNGVCSSEDAFNVNIISIPTPTISFLTQPTCAVQTGSIDVTSPVGAGGTIPSNIFISEVTDANTGSLTYVELYNATGTAVNLSGYKLRVYNNGLAAPSCDNILSGTIANNSTFIIKLSSDANIPGVSPDLVLGTCTGVNNNDNIRLTTSANAVLDMWGPSDGSTFTPAGQAGYTYRRLASATPLPNPVWTPADWTTLDPENYSNLDQYALFTSSYEYSVDNGTYQTGTTFTGLTPGNHTLIVHDLVNNCYSAPISFTINPVPYTTAVTDFTYTTPICITSATNPTLTLAAGFTSGGTFSYTGPVGSVLNLNTSTGDINLVGSNAGTYVVTYTFPTDLVNCINGNSSNFTIVIDPVVTAAFTQITNICQNAIAPTLPTTSNNSVAGTWSPSTINTSAVGTNVYTFTPNAGQCAIGTTMSITIDPIIDPSFTPIANICQNDAAPILQLTSNNGVTGTWSPSAINTAVSGTATYTFTPDAGQCSQVKTISVTIDPRVTPTFDQIETLCVGDANITLPTVSLNSIDGSWFPAVVDTAIEGTTVYTFTPNIGECASVVTMSVDVEFCQIQKGISPNGDGMNDYLKLVANKVEIFNRYGKSVYVKTNYNNDWHGQFQGGGQMPDGTYYYVIELASGDVKTGWIYINYEN